MNISVDQFWVVADLVVNGTNAERSQSGNPPHTESKMTFTATQILIATEFKAISQILTFTRQSDGKIYDAALCRYNSLACAGLIPCHWSEIVGW